MDNEDDEEKVKPSIFSLTKEKVNAMETRMLNAMTKEVSEAMKNGTYSASLEFSPETKKLMEEFDEARLQLKIQGIRMIAARSDSINIELMVESSIQKALDKRR